MVSVGDVRYLWSYSKFLSFSQAELANLEQYKYGHFDQTIEIEAQSNCPPIRILHIDV